MAILYDAQGNVIGDISDPISPTATQAQIRRIDNAIAAKKKNAKPKPVVATSSVSAKPGNANDVSTIGLPTQSPQTRGDVTGSIAVTNTVLIHSCDFSLSVKKNNALKKYMRAIAKWIRESIQKIKKLLGFSDPSGSYSEIINMLSAIKEFIDYVNEEFIQPIIEFEKYVLAVIIKVKAIIQWILSLPAKILAMLQECLTKLLVAIGSMFADEWAAAGKDIPTEAGIVQNADAGNGFAALATAAKGAYDSASSALSSATVAAGLAVGIAVSATAGILSPVSEEEIAGANATIVAFTGSVPDALSVPADPDFLKKSTP
jgi:hypothetical protein